MTKFWTLVGLNFKQQFRAKPQADKKGKKAGTIALYIVLALVFVPMLVGVFVACLQFGALTTMMSSITDEMMTAFVGSLVILAQGVTLLFGFSAVLSNVFNCRDADKLLYLPVDGATVFLSKFFVTYVNELVTSTVVMLCTLLPFGIGANMNAGFFVMFVLSLFLVPLLPMLVSTLVAMPLSLLSAAIMGVILQFIVPALVNVFINLSKIHSLPFAEYCVVVFLFLSASMLLCGAINLFAWFFPAAAVWITTLSPIVVTLGVGFAFFKVTAKLYFNDVTTVTYARSCVVAVAVLLVVLGVLL